ncbi:MAG: hypothetical protein IJZ01_02410 [Paraprevotella sp.]|nr:hypothetical protein [Paraprevotella sp.]
METTNNIIDGGVTAEQTAQWKQKHGKVVRIEINDGDDCHIGYFHRPNLETMSAVAKIAKTDELKSSEVIFDNCWLGGSPSIRHDAVLFIEATKQLGAMLNSCRSTLKNL